MSINVFGFTQDPPIVYASFWIFWVVSVILTLTVLGVYFGIVLIKKNLEKQEEKAKQEEQQEKLDLVRPPSDNAGSDGEAKGGSRRRRKRDSRQPKPEAALT
jgi:flagellar biosynthesis/type III secretory pathway M-ring protein FliF/YscJ